MTNVRPAPLAPRQGRIRYSNGRKYVRGRRECEHHELLLNMKYSVNDVFAVAELTRTPSLDFVWAGDIRPEKLWFEPVTVHSNILSQTEGA